MPRGELVVSFPTNVWEYDVLDYLPFADRQSEAEEPPSEATECDWSSGAVG